MTPSKIFLYFCLFFIGGIFLSSYLLDFLPNGKVYILLAGLILGILLISIFWNNKKTVVVGFSVLFLVLGIWRHQQTELKITDNELRKFNDSGQDIILIGTVSAEPDIREKSIKLTVKSEQLTVNGEKIKAEEKVLITTWRYPEHKYGDKLKITGKLESPSEDIEGFNYGDYLKKDGIYSIMSWPEIELLEKENYKGISSVIYAKILQFKEKLRKSIYQNFSPPQSAILGAMILGDKSRLSHDLKEKLNITGLRHITAVSGLHVAILTGILMTVLIGIGFWRKHAFWISIVLIFLFIITTGFQTSALRAGIMGSFFLLGQYLGKMSVSFRLIIFAAFFMLIQNPLLLRLDVGFQLSFLAITGIALMMPIFQDWFGKIPNIFQLKNVFAMTLSAQIFTLPILIYNFGYVSLIAPLTNVLIVPFLPFIMVSGFIFGLIGLIFQPLGWVLSWPAWVLLTYLSTTINWFSGFPFALKFFEISWTWLLFYYLILSLIIWRLQENRKLKFLRY